MRIGLVFFLLCSLSAFAQESAPLPIAKKLVDGSPWRFSTRYENTLHEFRLTNDGKLQRMSSGDPGVWLDVTVSANQTIDYKTTNGHIITFHLDRNGNAAATHSKHPSQFRSAKE